MVECSLRTKCCGFESRCCYLITHSPYSELLLLIFLFNLFSLLLIILILFLFQNHVVFHKIYIIVLKSLNLHLTFVRYRVFHYLAYLTPLLLKLFLVLSIILVFLFHLICFLNLLTHP